MHLKRIFLALLFILHLAIFWKLDLFSFLLGRVQLWDFDVYHQTAVDVRAGAHPYKLSYMQTAGPPLVILPYIPFSFLPLTVARGLIILLSLVSIFGTSWLLARKVLPKYPLIFALILNFIFLLLFQPRFNFILGQPNLIIMFLITVLLTQKQLVAGAGSSGREDTLQKMFIGILFAIISILKTHYVVAWLALLKHSRNTIAFGAVALLTAATIGFFIIKPIYYQDYLTSRLSSHVAQSLVISDVSYYNQSLRATLARVYLADTYAVVSLIILVGAGWYVFKSSDMAAGFLLALLISPVVWQHYMVISYPIIFLTTLSYLQHKKFPLHLGFAAVLLLSHLPWLHEKLLSLPLGILASHYYLGLVLLLYSRIQLDTVQKKSGLEN